MKVQSVAVLGTRPPVRTEPPVKVLTNHPCDVKMTIQVNGRPAQIFTFENESEGRNLLARMIPTPIFEANPEEVLKYTDDSAQPMYDFLLSEAKAEGLDLPSGL